MFLSKKNTNTLVNQVHFYPLVPSEVSELLGLGTDMDVKWTPGSSTDTFLFFLLFVGTARCTNAGTSAGPLEDADMGPRGLLHRMGHKASQGKSMPPCIVRTRHERV